MNTPMHIRMAILRTLEAYSPTPVSTEPLLKAVNHDIPRVISTEQLAVELVWLATNGLVNKITYPLDPDVARWVITRAGLGALSQ